MTSPPILEALSGFGALACMLVIFVASIGDIPEAAMGKTLVAPAQVGHE